MHGVAGSVTSSTSTVADSVGGVAAGVVSVVGGIVSRIVRSIGSVLCSVNDVTTRVVRVVRDVPSVGGRHGVERGRRVRVAIIVGSSRVVVHRRCCRCRVSRVSRRACVIVSGAGLDHNRFNLLSHNRACGLTVIVGRVLVVHGRVLVTILAPTPGQEARDRRGGQAAEDNASNGAARQLLGLIIHGHGALGGSGNGGCGDGDNNAGGTSSTSGVGGYAAGGAINDTRGARDPGGGASNQSGAADNSRSVDPASGAVDNGSGAAIVGRATPNLSASTSINVVVGGGRGDKGGGAMAGAVLVGVTIRVAQAGDTAAFEETLDVGSVLFVFQDRKKDIGNTI